MSRLLSIICILILFSSIKLMAQYSISSEKDTTLQNALEQIQVYFQQNPPQTNSDSTFLFALYTLNAYSNNTQLIRNLSFIKAYIELNNHQLELNQLKDYGVSLKQKKQANDLLRQELCSSDSVIKLIDSGGLSTADSNFVDLLDIVFTDSIPNDSISLRKTAIDSIVQANFYTDSLINSLNTIINYYTNDSLMNWISEIRSDTTYFYIIDLQGDSVRLKLFKNNPKIVRFNINDFWGSDIPALFRDIQAHSARLLIDDLPDIDSPIDDEDLQIIDSVNTFKYLGYDITFKKRPMPMIKSPWSFYGNVNIDASQMGLYQWSKGGESTIAGLAGVELFSKYKKKKISWDNYMKLKFGVIRQGAYYNDSTAFFKTNNDRIDIESKLGYKVFGKYSTSVLTNFKSQFANGYEYPSDTSRNLISQFMSPAYITFALGLDYKPSKNNTFFLSPLTSKTTIILNDSIDQTKYGLLENENIRYEIGAIFKAYFKIKIWGDIEMENNLELFSNYLIKPQNIDIDWDFKLTFPVNDFIRATISTSLIYDDDELVPKKVDKYTTIKSKGLQFKETLSIGFYMIF